MPASSRGELSPGERLVEEELAEQLGQSRGAIRTALLRLEHDRLVVRERNRGARVRRISAEEAVEILEARAALESLAAGYAALRRTDADVKELRKITAEMEKLHAAGELLAMSERNAVAASPDPRDLAPHRRAGDLRAAELADRALPVPHRARAGPAGEVAGRARARSSRRSPPATARRRRRRCAAISLMSPRRCWPWRRGERAA